MRAPKPIDAKLKRTEKSTTCSVVCFGCPACPAKQDQKASHLDPRKWGKEYGEQEEEEEEREEAEDTNVNRLAQRSLLRIDCPWYVADDLEGDYK
eukprot:8989988-Pyramimonas_sp.AAC.1